MNNVLKTVCSGMAVLAMTSSMAFAFSNNANENADDGQAKAIANCIANIEKQNAKGQTGANTGSENDSKQADTAVTNCDKFWSPPN